MRVASILSIVLSASVSVTAFAEKKALKDYWAETGINLQFIEERHVIRDASCAANTAAMLGCLSALNVLGETASPALTVVPTSYLSGPYNSDFGAVVKTIGAFSIVQTIKKPAAPNASTRSIYQSLEKKRAAQIASVEQVIKSGHSKDTEEIYKFIKAQALPELQKKKLEPLAAAAMYNANFVQAEDAHGRITPSAKVADDLRDASEELIGIGAQLSKRPDLSIIVQSVKPGSPAEKSNLMPGDVITAVDGVSVDGVSLDQVIDKIRGKENTVVRVRVNRGGKVYEAPMTRTRVVTQNVETRLDTLNAETKVGYIRLRSFMDETSCIAIAFEVAELAAKGAKGFILDLRDNGGGLLDQGVCISAIFIGRKLVVRERDLVTGHEVKYSGKIEQVTKLPTVVLMNALSASASEIVAGALQDHSRAWIMGERSYGKGTVQRGVQYAPNIMKFSTVSRFHQPTGRTNQIHGIIPDIEVPAKPGMSEDERFVPREKELYPNALSAIGNPWVQTRPDEVAKLQDCMAKTGNAEKLYELQSDRQIPPEYQVLKAQDAIRCLK